MMLLKVAYLSSRNTSSLFRVRQKRCPLVVLARGQVGCQCYLSFGQVNLQEIILKNKVFKCLSGEISIQLRFCKCKADCFHKSNLEVGNEMS